MAEVSASAAMEWESGGRACPAGYAGCANGGVGSAAAFAWKESSLGIVRHLSLDRMAARALSSPAATRIWLSVHEMPRVQ